MINLEVQKRNFKNHVANFTDYGNIKILDFKNPESNDYRIRFLFEEEYCRLHISGDLGELIAVNYYNMTYDKFGDFLNNPGYFMGKVECHNRPFYTYDESDAWGDLALLIEEEFGEVDEDELDDVLHEALCDYSDYGIGNKGYEILSERYCFTWDDLASIGRRETGIIELYLMAFKLAKEQLDRRK